MDSFVSNFSSAMADEQKFPSSNVWGSAAGRLNFDSPLLFRDQSEIDGNNIAAGDSNLFSPAKSGWGLPSLPHTESRRQPLSGAGDVLSFDEICRQLPNLSLMASQDESFECGLGAGDRDPNGHRLRARSALPNWAMDSEGRLVLNIGEILKKGLLQQFAKDRLGCQYLQTLYPTANTEDRLVIIKEVLEDPTVFVNLSCDVFGNYFVQQMIGCATTSEQLYVVNRLKNHMFQLCLNRYSCRVVQKALDVLPHDLKLGLIFELHDADLVRLCVDQNGNHVIQKIMNGFPVNTWSFLIETFLRDEQNLFETAENKYGCRIIQLAVEQLTADIMRTRQSEVLLKRMIAVITANCMRLTLNEFSNYIIQFIIGCESLTRYRDRIIDNCLLRNLLSMSQEKYASHVIEKAMQHAPRELLHEMMDEIFDGYVPHPETHRDALDIMMFHQFGNYIIQRMLSICVDAVRVWKSGGTMVDMNQRLTWLRRLSKRIATNESRLAKYSSGKKLIDMLNEVPPILRSPECTQADLNRPDCSQADLNRPDCSQADLNRPDCSQADLDRARAFYYNRRPSPAFAL